jgi:uncharacterized phage-associated protein
MVKKEVHTQSFSSDEDEMKLNKYFPGGNTYKIREADSTSSAFNEELVSNKNEYGIPQRIINKEITTSVFDVSAYILKQTGTISTMKLQKLVWDEAPIFHEDIEAWANGPVIKDLFIYHRGSFMIDSLPIGNPELLSEKQKETIDAVLKFYGDKSAQWLIELSHNETPWITTRRGIENGERGNKIIPLDLMAHYYSSL